MACGVCGIEGHTRVTCVYHGPRTNLKFAGPKSMRCECCGSYRYVTQRHHTRGRADDSDYLDVCIDCHVECCHLGDFYNLPKKPRVCRITGNKSWWCS